MATTLCVEVQFAKDLKNSEFRIGDPFIPWRQLDAYVQIKWDEFSLETPAKKVVEGRADFSTSMSFSLPRKGNTLEIKVYDKRGVQAVIRGDSLIGEASLEVDLSKACQEETVSLLRDGQKQGDLSLLLKKQTLLPPATAMYSQPGPELSPQSARNVVALPASMYDINNLSSLLDTSPTARVNVGEYNSSSGAPITPTYAPVVQAGSYGLMSTVASPSAYAQRQNSLSAHAEAQLVAAPSAYAISGQSYSLGRVPATPTAYLTVGPVASLPAAEDREGHAYSAIAPGAQSGSYRVIQSVASPSAYTTYDMRGIMTSPTDRSSQA